MNIKENFYDYEDLCDMEICSKVTAIRWVKAGKFVTPVTLSNAPNAKRLFPKDKVDAWVEKQITTNKVVYK